MKNITEAILSKKNISNIVDVDQELFKRDFRSVYSSRQNLEYIINPKKYDYAVIKLNFLIKPKDPKDIEINSYILKTDDWALNKEIAFSSYAGDKRLETKYPITIIFEGDYIEGFTFIGSNINFIIGSHQRVKDCDFLLVKDARFFFYDESNKDLVLRRPTFNVVFNTGAFIVTTMEEDDIVEDRTSELRKIFDIRSIKLPQNKAFYVGVQRSGKSKYSAIASVFPDQQAVMDALNCPFGDLHLRYFR